MSSAGSREAESHPISPEIAAAAHTLRRASWAMLAGNFAIGCGAMVIAGSLNDLVSSLQVSVAVGTLHHAALGFMGLAILLSLWLGRHMRAGVVHV